jgi:DNA-binding SARP family transcriptional activator
MSLRLNVLGGLSLSREGQPLVGAAGQRKPLAFLAVIERAGTRGITRDKLMGYLVPESDEARARGVLKQLLYTLRKGSGGAELTLGVSTLSLNGDVVECDLRMFEQHCAAREWRAAVDLYSGPYLDGIHVAGSAEFDEWVEQHRRATASLYHRALRELAVADDAASPGGGEGWWSRLGEVDPLDAQVVVGHMRSLTAAGKRAIALQLSRSYEARIREELGIEADPAIQAARSEIEREATPVPLLPPGLAPATRSADALPPVRPTRARRWLAVTGLAAMASLGLASAMGAWGPSRHARPAAGGRTVPLSEVANFTNQSGVDSLGFLGPIIGDRIALDLGARGIALSHRPSDTTVLENPPELLIDGGYFTAGDTFFIQAHVKVNGTRYDLVDLPLLIGTVQSANTVIDTVVNRISLGITREFETIRREWALDSTEGRNPAALLWFAVATRRAYGDFKCEERLDFLDSALVRDPSLIPALLYHAELSPWCRNELGQHQSNRLAKVRKRLQQQQAGQSAFTTAYIDYLLLPDSAAKLHAARNMLVAAPHSHLALGRLVRTLADYNQYGEIIRAWEDFHASTPELAAEISHDPMPDGSFPYADALHLAGRYAEELRQADAALDRHPSLAKGVRFRAMAALHRPVDMKTAGLALSGTYTLNGNLLLLYADELAVHGNSAMADSIARVLPARSCDRLEESWRSSVRPPHTRSAQDMSDWTERMRIQSRQLQSVARSLRYGCVDDAGNGLTKLSSPVVDSVWFMALKGELAASRGDSAAADSAIAWFHDTISEGARRQHVPWFTAYSRARIAARLGRREQAFQLLSAALEGGMAVTMDLHTDPLWRSFADDPMFRAVVGR